MNPGRCPGLCYIGLSGRIGIARARFADSSLVDLYDPLTMPPELVKAHQVLDKAVDKCYRGAAFGSETERLEYLFGLYNEYTEPLIKAETKKKRRKNKG